MKNNENKFDNIVISKFPKRFFGFLIDTLIVGIVSIILYFSCTSTVLYNAIGGKETWNNFISFCNESQLYVTEKDDNGDYTSKLKPLSFEAVETKDNKQEKPGYLLYFEKISDFYVDFLPTNKNIDPVGDKKASDFYTVEYFNTQVVGLPVIEDTNFDGNEKTISDKRNYFKYRVNKDDGKVLVNELPVLTNEVQNLIDSGSKEMKIELNQYFFNNTNEKDKPTGLYVTAVETFSKQSYSLNLLDEYNQIKYICRMVTTVPAILIFFLLIPLCTPNGETVGKLILGTGVCSKNGYKLSMASRFTRPIYMTIVIGLPYFFPSKYAPIITTVTFVILVIDYILMASDKSSCNRCLHDRLCGTMVYDKKNSLVFRDEHDEQEYNTSHHIRKNNNDEKLSPEALCKIEKEQSVIDLDSLQKHKEIIDSIDSFDEFEDRDI